MSELTSTKYKRMVKFELRHTSAKSRIIKYYKSMIRYWETQEAK